MVRPSFALLSEFAAVSTWMQQLNANHSYWKNVAAGVLPVPEPDPSLVKPLSAIALPNVASVIALLEYSPESRKPAASASVPPPAQGPSAVAEALLSGVDGVREVDADEDV